VGVGGVRSWSLDGDEGLVEDGLRKRSPDAGDSQGER